jgi:hypothetical protein
MFHTFLQQTTLCRIHWQKFLIHSQIRHQLFTDRSYFVSVYALTNERRCSVSQLSKNRNLVYFEPITIHCFSFSWYFRLTQTHTNLTCSHFSQCTDATHTRDLTKNHCTNTAYFNHTGINHVMARTDPST